MIRGVSADGGLLALGRDSAAATAGGGETREREQAGARGVNIGGSTEFANYASGSGSTSLVFQYTVQPGDTDNNGIAIRAARSS